jgi:hypothetical protein
LVISSPQDGWAVILTAAPLKSDHSGVALNVAGHL